MALVDEIREAHRSNPSVYREARACGLGALATAAVDRARQRGSFVCAPLGSFGRFDDDDPCVRRFWFEEDQAACVRYANANALRLYADLSEAFQSVRFEFEPEDRREERAAAEEAEAERFTIRTRSERRGLTLRVVLAPSRDWIFDARLRGVENFKAWQWQCYGYCEEIRAVGAMPTFLEVRETATGRVVRQPAKSYDPIDAVREIFEEDGCVSEGK